MNLLKILKILCTASSSQNEHAPTHTMEAQEKIVTIIEFVLILDSATISVLT